MNIVQTHASQLVSLSKRPRDPDSLAKVCFSLADDRCLYHKLFIATTAKQWTIHQMHEMKKSHDITPPSRTLLPLSPMPHHVIWTSSLSDSDQHNHLAMHKCFSIVRSSVIATPFYVKYAYMSCCCFSLRGSGRCSPLSVGLISFNNSLEFMSLTTVMAMLHFSQTCHMPLI